MSQWNDKFSLFKESWENLYNQFNEIDREDIDEEDILAKINRFEKIMDISSIIIKKIDPETLSIANLDSLNNSAKNIETTITALKDSNNFGYIDTCNTKIDEIYQILSKYQILDKKSLVDISDLTKKRYSELSKEYEKIKHYSSEMENELKEKINTINKFYEEIEGNEENKSNSLKSKIKDSYHSAIEFHEEIERLHQEIYNGTDDADAISDDIKEAWQDIKQKREDVKKDYDLFEEKLDELDDFYKKIFGDSESGKVGLAEELVRRKKELDEFKNQQEQRYKELNNQIENLLPGATSAGLAKAYHDAKESFFKPKKSFDRMFIGSIVFLVAFELFMICFGYYRSSDNLKTSLSNFLYQLPIYIPVIWFAIYASKRRSENQRLEQEYAHKEALAKSYISYKNQIENLDEEDQEMLKELMKISLDAISFNASSTLDKKHGEDHLISSLFSSFKSKNTDDSENK